MLRSSHIWASIPPPLSWLPESMYNCYENSCIFWKCTFYIIYKNNLLIQTFHCQSAQDGLITLFSKYISCCLFSSPEGSNFNFHNVLGFQFRIIYAAPGFLGIMRYELGKISFVSYSLQPHSTNPGAPIVHKVRCISIARLVNLSWEWWMTFTGICVNKNTDGEFRWLFCKDTTASPPPPLLRLDPNLRVSRISGGIQNHRAI